jgi:putative flippase GtrA
MGNLARLIFAFRLKALLFEKTEDVYVQAFRALFVGGAAFVADAGLLWLISLSGVHYLICGAVSFVMGVAVNYTLSSLFVFSQTAKIGGREVGKSGEIIVYLIVSVVGLLITEFIMWLFTDVFGMFYMLSKCAAALLAFGWNFTARKFLLYKGR